MSYNPTLSELVTELRAGDIDVKPINRDWSERGPDDPAVNYWQAVQTERPNAQGDSRWLTIVSQGYGVLLVRDGAGRTVNVQYSDSVDEYKEATRQDDDDLTPLDAHALSDDELWALERLDVDSAEGPMMNYWYPCPVVEDDPEAAALAIGDLPLCVVEIDGEGWGLGLTGGGMDLSWEIAEAFCRLGQLPPVHYADLPAMAWGNTSPENTARRQYVLAAMLRSLEVTAERAQWRADRLRETFGDLLSAGVPA